MGSYLEFFFSYFKVLVALCLSFILLSPSSRASMPIHLLMNNIWDTAGFC